MNEVLFAVPSAFVENVAHKIDESSNVILPNSFLANMCNNEEYEFPYQFEICALNNKKINVSVIDFTSDSEIVIIPFWMFETLEIEAYEPIKINYKKINKGNYMKIQPHKTKFIEHKDPREILETKLSNFSCLTKNTTISFVYNDEIYKFNILELKDDKGECDSISILNVDLNIDFERPLDKPPTPILKPQFQSFTKNGVECKNMPLPQQETIFKTTYKKEKNDNLEIKDEAKFVPFSGKGYKLGNK